MTDQTRKQLEAIERQHSPPQRLVRRVRIILQGAAGVDVRQSAAHLGLSRSTVQRWRARWRATDGQPLHERLADAPRSGAPATFTAQQVCSLIALACEPPSAYNLVQTHWTQAALAHVAVQEGLV
ncbi:helix-turn-helix domain-containing protein, partial [Thiohalocapsa marina]|uniref:helix-turn-helix domain-containing protein n=1 Tax=Thiohalocapsa marina TaxID=424902 RepID=UPI0014784F9D